MSPLIFIGVCGLRYGMLDVCRVADEQSVVLVIQPRHTDSVMTEHAPCNHYA